MSARAAAKPTPGLVLGGEPRANLLPPEVAERSKAKRTRGALVFVVIAALIVTGAGYGLATLRELQAQAALASSQARTLALLEERAELSETIAVINVERVVTETRLQATASEVIWADFLDRVTGVLPPNGYLDWLAQAPTPWESQLSVDGPLREPRVASITLKVASPTPFDSTALYRKIIELDGIADGSIDTVEQPPGELTYEVTYTINLSDDALSGRWVEDEGSSDEGDAAEEGNR